MIYFFFIILAILLIPPMLMFAPWVPTRKGDIVRVLKLANLKKGETFVDLGSGSGTLVFGIANQGNVQAVGIELSWPLYLYSQIKKVITQSKKTRFVFDNLFKANLSDYNVVYLFGLKEHLGQKLIAKFRSELKPGSRIISYCFPVSGLEPKTIDKPTDKDLPIFLYIIK